MCDDVPYYEMDECDEEEDWGRWFWEDEEEPEEDEDDEEDEWSLTWWGQP